MEQEILEIQEESIEKKPTSALKAIRQRCLDCCCWQTAEVKACTAEQCSLWEFRFGKNPYAKRILTDEQRCEMVERGKKLAESRHTP